MFKPQKNNTFVAGMPPLGTACDLYHDIFDIVGTSNVPLRPMPGTVHRLPWAANGKYKVYHFPAVTIPLKIRGTMCFVLPVARERIVVPYLQHVAIC